MQAHGVSIFIIDRIGAVAVSFYHAIKGYVNFTHITGSQREMEGITQEDKGCARLEYIAYSIYIWN